MSQPVIRLSAVSKSFPAHNGGTFLAVKNVSLEIAQGDIFGLIGKSGAGKSSVLRLINLLEQPDSGSVVVAGRELTQLNKKGLRSARQQIGMISSNLIYCKTPMCSITSRFH